MDIKQLTYFMAVAQEGSYSKAAEKLGISQPTLSIAVKKLEEELGLPLFYTFNRRQVLTDGGLRSVSYTHLPPAAAGEQSDGGGRAGAGRAPPRPGPGFDGDGPCGLCRGSGSVCAQKGPSGIPERCGLPHLRFSPALHRAAALPVALQCPEVDVYKRQI